MCACFNHRDPCKGRYVAANLTCFLSKLCEGTQVECAHVTAVTVVSIIVCLYSTSHLVFTHISLFRAKIFRECENSKPKLLNSGKQHFFKFHQESVSEKSM